MTSNDRTDDILATMAGRPTAAQRAADDAAQARAEDMLNALQSGGPALTRQDRRIAERLNNQHGSRQ